MTRADTARHVRQALNTPEHLIDVLVRLQSAQDALRDAKRCADEIPDRTKAAPHLSERIAEIEDMVDSLIEGLR